MKNKFSVGALVPVLIALCVFFLLTFSYFSPLLKGRILSMYDINMSSAAAKELVDHHEKTGEWVWWTNSSFGGMPSFMISGGYPYNLMAKVGAFLYNLFPIPANVFLLVMIGFYIFARISKFPNWLSIAASVAYAFCTYNLLFIEAGHISKILAMAFLPGILAGLMLIIDKKYWLGTFVMALFIGLELYSNHIQITYYFMFILLAFGIFQLIKIIRNGDAKSLPIMALCILVATLVGVGMHTERLWNNMVYAEETIRGKSELKQSTAGQDGLDRDYAFGWSYGIAETLNMIVPNLMGGGSNQGFDENSESFKVLTQNGIDRASAIDFVRRMPSYFGPQSSTSGPAYSGVVVILLFIFGLFYRKDKIKWLQLGIAIFLIMLAWGNHFPSFNYFIYEHLPAYNKFRAVSMILIIAHFVLVWGAAATINELIESKPDFETIKKPLLFGVGTVLGLIILGYLSVNFVGQNDEAFLNNLKQSNGDALANQLGGTLHDDRTNMALSDIYRNLFLIALMAGLLFLFAKSKLNATVLSIILLVLVTFDYFSVGKRYLNENDFERKIGKKPVSFQMTAADMQILQDPDPNYKVINISTSFMSDARDSYFHKSLGGYHAAKLKKYQELVDNQMIKDDRLNMGIMNMLNTKYFISNGENGPVAQPNPGALGNAWFVDSLKVVATADEELAETGGINTARVAVTQRSFLPQSKAYSKDSTEKIRLTSYAPNKLVYSSNTTKPQFAVFSEIFYRGNKDWVSTLDGKITNHLKVNYLLRGMEIPVGKHEIVFEFKPESVEKGQKFDLAASVAFVLLFAGSVFTAFRTKKEL